MATTVTKVIDPDMGSGADYDSLYDWEAAQQGDLTGVRDEIAVAKCRCTGGTADGTDWLTVDGWETSATQYPKIWTDPSETYRHNGTYQTGNKYRFESTTANDWNRPFRILESYVRLIGVQIKLNVSHGSCSALDIDSASNIIIDKCIVVGNVTGGSNLTLWGISAPVAGMKISNTTVYDFVSGTGTCKGMSIGITYDSASSWVYNCTVQNCRIGFQDYAGGSTVFKNCIAQDCYDGYADASSSSSNCVSDLDSDAPGSNARNLTTVSFVDKDNNNFHLASTDTGAKGYGTNLYNDANYAFQDDIDGQDRGGSGATWDIGADQYALHKKWRTAATELALDSALWSEWPSDGIVKSLNFVQVRLEALT